MAVAIYALTTRARLKAFLDISADDATTNAVLDNVINATTDWAESYCQRRFSWTAYTNEKYDGSDSQSLMVRNYPIQTGETFTLSIRNSSLDEDSWSTIDSENYFITPEFGYIEYPKAIYGDEGRLFVIGNQNYRVTYTAGFYVPQHASYVEGAATSLPMDLEYAAWKLASVAWNSRRGGDDVQSERLGAYAVTFKKEAFEDERITDILNKYSRQHEYLAWR